MTHKEDKTEDKTSELKGKSFSQSDEDKKLLKSSDPFSAHIVGHVRLTEEQKKARRRRNLALALLLAGWMVFIFLVTIFKLKGGVLTRPL